MGLMDRFKKGQSEGREEERNRGWEKRAIAAHERERRYGPVAEKLGRAVGAVRRHTEPIERGAARAGGFARRQVRSASRAVREEADYAKQQYKLAARLRMRRAIRKQMGVSTVPRRRYGARVVVVGPGGQAYGRRPRMKRKRQQSGGFGSGGGWGQGFKGFGQ